MYLLEVLQTGSAVHVVCSSNCHQGEAVAALADAVHDEEDERWRHDEDDETHGGHEGNA